MSPPRGRETVADEPIPAPGVTKSHMDLVVAAALFEFESLVSLVAALPLRAFLSAFSVLWACAARFLAALTACFVSSVKWFSSPSS